MARILLHNIIIFRIFVCNDLLNIQNGASMTENYSLQLSKEIKSLMQSDLSGAFKEMFPFEELQKLKTGKERDRVYNTETTLLTMIMAMTQEDKGLKNSVLLYSKIHENMIGKIQEKREEVIKESERRKLNKQAGRPSTKGGWVAKSKTKPVSLDTSGYAQARLRLPIEAVDLVFRASANAGEINQDFTWHGFRTFITDGTYVQMQDSEKIKEEFPNTTKDGYPRGLIEAVIEQGTGLVHDFRLSSNSRSELELMAEMITDLPKGSLLLADDLYNCFAIFSLLKSSGVEMIVSGKRDRKFKVVGKIERGDELVKIKQKNKSKWLKDRELEHKELILRRIEYIDPKKGKTSIIYTTILDDKIRKEEIILKYRERWDIEVSIRELKTIMDIGIVRAKSSEMAYKEVTTALIAYNYIRKIIVKITENSDFSPEEDIIQKYSEIFKPILVDRLGRKYYKWSPGRGGYSDIKD
jgi:hypothetical protein